MKKFIFAGLLALFVMSCNGNIGAAVSDSTAVDSVSVDSTLTDSTCGDGLVNEDSVVVDSAAAVLK